MSTKQLSTGQLVLRSLLPSMVSLVLCLMFGVLITLAHIVLTSVSQGTSLPGILDGQWSVAYTQNVVEPLIQFFNISILNRLAVACMWGVVGLILYLGFEYAVHTYKSLKQAQEEVALNAKGKYEKQPRRRDFLRGMFWRAGMLVVGIIFLIAMIPLLTFAFRAAPQVVLSRSLGQDWPLVLGAVGAWSLFFHGIVVFIRLYLFRTRIFGDEDLY